MQDLGGEKEISSEDDISEVEKALQTKKEEITEVTEESAEEASVAEEEKEA